MVATHAHIYLPVFRQKLSSFIMSRSICVKRRNELNMKPAAVTHVLSPRNFNFGSYTRSPHVGGLTVSRHPAVVHAGGGVSIYIHFFIYICIYIFIYKYIYIWIYILLSPSPVEAGLEQEPSLDRYLSNVS